jgi:hypothetical protein
MTEVVEMHTFDQVKCDKTFATHDDIYVTSYNWPGRHQFVVVGSDELVFSWARSSNRSRNRPSYRLILSHNNEMTLLDIFFKALEWTTMQGIVKDTTKSNEYQVKSTAGKPVHIIKQ